MLSVITELRVDEPARFNPEKLEDLCHRIGDAQAETEVALALDRIAAMLNALPSLSVRAHVPDLRDAVEVLISDAELIGMTTLARVERNVVDCIERGNLVAIAATLARLERVGDRSIHAVWDLEDMSV